MQEDRPCVTPLTEGPCGVRPQRRRVLRSDLGLRAAGWWVQSSVGAGDKVKVQMVTTVTPHYGRM